ncbi:hypothetical protein [Tunturiibacter gelidoferens]|uniref:VWA domain-containing protein n=1 Tax=Tunturiibacter lichenicola TaxID=2051959 RepID=A0A7Y9NIW9_9BACT|nr:hypothetical protein [Edaphobacter lichenicola]NYF50215.1 hypothetical protein [Edaphobacter lichenicola]
MTMPKLQRRISKEKKRNRLPGITRIPACTILLLALAAVGATAQSSTEAAPTAQQAPSPDATPTLHVYTNLKQVPVLVLTDDYQRMKPLDTSKFRISLDSGPQFPPTYVRQEGRDPISLSILIDASKPDNQMLPRISQAIAGLAPDYLQPQDRVSIYVLDCTLIRTAYEAPANAAVLRQTVDRGLTPWQIRQRKKGSAIPCKPSIPLWDSMANVLDELAPQSGRRVLLAITDGEDSGSRTLWSTVRRRAQFESIAVFGLLPTPVFAAMNRRDLGEIKVDSSSLRSTEDKFNQICGLSGGVEVQQRYGIVSWRLREFLQMVRERYILEFPRSPTEEAGEHTIAVSYRKRDLYIAPSGITVPVASEDEKKGANTVPINSSQAPVEGSRRVLLPNQ